MAWTIPSLQDLVERTRGAFATYLPGSDATVWPSNVAVAAKVIAGRLWEIFQRQEYLHQQAFVITATGNYLDRHAAVYGLSRNTNAASTGSILISGGTHTTLVPQGTQYQDSNGNIFQTSDAAYIDEDGAATIAVEATNTGAGIEVDGSETLNLQAVIAGVPTTAVVGADGINGGADVEGDDSFRARILERIRVAPQAGSESDYVRWAKEKAGVTRAWAIGNAYGPGTVAVFFMMDDAYADGIPQAADSAALQTSLEALAPITATVSVSAPTAFPVAISITDLEPFNTDVVEAIKLELRDIIKERGSVSTLSDPFIFKRSWVWQAVSNATGETSHTVALPASDIQVPGGMIPTYSDSLTSITA